MKILLVFALVLSLVLSQGNVGSTTSCPKPCYSANTNPCPSTDLVCKENPTGDNGSPSSNCPRVCVKRNATSDEVSAAFSTCTTPCDISYYQCTLDQYCKQYNTCSNCEPKPCNQVQCTQAPCAADAKGKACAAKVSANAVCIDNYCGGCFAEWYVGTTRICTDVPDTCSPCNDVCPTNSKRKINIYTGCEDCASECVTTCPTLTCDSTVQCPYGRKLENGCPTCQCNPCPDLSNCNLQCTEYLVDPNTQCKKCACANSGCPTSTTPCTLNCTNGYTVDANGCKECKCKEICPQLTCTNNVDCVNGRVYKDNCPTCECLPYCQNQCPYGYDFNSAGTTSNSLECKCYCKPLVCERDCPNAAYVIDIYGCKTCECVVYDTCTKVQCDLYCEHGYVKDEATGCPKCECVQKPTVCPAILCNADCIYGNAPDQYGCPTCQCKPCPEVLCARYCQYGFKKGSTGCEICECNPAPACPTGSVDVANTCPLNCEKGYVTDSGCTYCKCNPFEPCQCVPTGVPDSPILCPDGVTYQKTTDLCARTVDNKCYYVQTTCPIGIELTINVKLTEAQIHDIATKIGATNTADIQTQFVEKDGTYTYTFWVSKEGIPEGKTATDVNRDVGDEAKKQDPNAISFVLSDGSVTQSFANVLVPFIGLISLVLFF